MSSWFASSRIRTTPRFSAIIFRLVHTIKGTCGFLGLPRLEALTHAAEALMGNFRDGVPVTGDAVTLILATIDRIKTLLDELERNQAEAPGDDQDLIEQLERMAAEPAGAQAEAQGHVVGTLVPQVLERPLRPGEVSLDELERAFRAAPGPDRAAATPQAAPTPQPKPPTAADSAARTARPEGRDDERPDTRSPTSRSASTSTRSNT